MIELEPKFAILSKIITENPKLAPVNEINLKMDHLYETI
jgi:hypothetical protein